MSELTRGDREQHPVFLDKRGNRAFCTNLFLAAVGISAAIGILLVARGLILTPALPPLSAGGPTLQSAPSSPEDANRPSLVLAVNSVHNRYIPQQAVHALRFAFLDHADVGSFASLQQHANQIDAIIPDWLEIARPDGVDMLKAERKARTVQIWLRQHAPHIKIYPELSTTMRGGDLVELLVDPTGRKRLIDAITRYLKDNNFSGLTVSLGHLPRSAHRTLVAFLEELGHALRADGRQLLFMLPDDETAQRIKALTRPCDYVLLKLHDDDSTQQTPIAAQNRFEARLKSQSAGIDRSKLVVVVASLGYDWDEWGGKRLISNQAAWDLASRTNTKPVFDPGSLNPGFTYRDETGTHHHVWYLDAVTAFNHLRAALATQPSGIAIWRLGLEDRGVWASAGRGRLPDERALADIISMAPGYDSFTRANAVALGVQPGNAGERQISYNPGLSLAVNQSIVTFPRQAVLTEWHPAEPDTIAITFDDGPDPNYTPKILDILAQRSAKATFYVVGVNALTYPDLLRRIYDEGHDLGHHSWSHAEMHSGASLARIRSELNGTQRVFEGTLGIKCVLFRPPYTGSNYSQLDNAVDLVRIAAELGYVFAAFDANSFDYFFQRDQIVAETLARVQSGARVLLFHDAGGDRQRTIDALPIVIDELQAKGFRFVTTHELIGKSRSDVMSPVVPDSSTERAEALIRVKSAGFLLWLSEAIPTVAIAAALLGILRILLIIIAALVQARRTSGRRVQWHPDKIAVLVPAYNEEEVICKTVSALLSSTCADRLQILVVDDGSRDRTSDVVREAYGHDPRVLVHRKDNGGKASALNFGIDMTDADIIVAIDGDTILTPDAIDHLVTHFRDPTIGAVAGNVIVGNQTNLITRFQALEYITSQNLDRRAFELVNAIGVIPGAIGAWRRSALIEAQGYSKDTLAEDADLTLSIERNGWRVVGEPQARALTEAPETVRSFMKQRFRWMFGTLQVAWKHARRRGRGHGVTLVVIPNVFVFQFGFTLLAPIMDILLVIAVAGALIDAENETSVLLAKYWVFFQTVDAIAAAVGIALSHERRSWRLLPLIFLQRFCYRQLLYVVATRALLAAIKGRLVGWGKLVRTGSVALPASQDLQTGVKTS